MNGRRGQDHDLGQIADWLAGRLAEPEASRLADEVARDPKLAEDVAWVRSLMRAGTQLPLVQPPARLRDQLREEYLRRTQGPGSSEVPHARTGPQFARLVYDSRRNPLAGGVRRVGTGKAAVRLVWRTASAELLAELRGLSADRVRIDGQLLSEQGVYRTRCVVVATGPGVWLEALGDTYGRFSLVIQESVEQLLVRAGDIEVVARLDEAEGTEGPLHAG